MAEKKKTIKDILGGKNNEKYSTTVKVAVAGVVVFFIIFIIMAGSSNRGRNDKNTGNLGNKYQVISTNLEVFSKKMNQRIIGLEKKENELEEGRKQLNQKIKSLNNQQNQIITQLDNLTATVADLANQIKEMQSTKQTVRQQKETRQATKLPPPQQRIFTVNLPSPPKALRNVSNNPTNPQVKKTKKQHETWVSLPDGSIVKATIVSGIFAPVTSSQWLPTLLNLDEAFYGPNNTRVPLQGCKVLARAQGDYTTNRASVNAYKISCVLPDGKARVFKVKGYVTDSKDSAFGVQGKIISKSGKYILGSVLTSFLQGFSQGLSQGETTQTVTETGATVTSVTGNATKYAGFAGASGSFSKLSEYYQSKLNKMIDMIYIPSGRVVWLVIQKGCVLKGVKPSEFYSFNPFGGMD